MRRANIFWTELSTHLSLFVLKAAQDKIDRYVCFHHLCSVEKQILQRKYENARGYSRQETLPWKCFLYFDKFKWAIGCISTPNLDVPFNVSNYLCCLNKTKPIFKKYKITWKISFMKYKHLFTNTNTVLQGLRPLWDLLSHEHLRIYSSL